MADQNLTFNHISVSFQYFSNLSFALYVLVYIIIAQILWKTHLYTKTIWRLKSSEYAVFFKIQNMEQN
jgi:hypothetical protein